ncbi:MAG: AAA family ATPase [Candidatus Krumholzibacteria bacterium]|jgi:type II secretory pathway predicted ATPase ExeA|nr:AAA family ATPase [Candidatus Krumholzibacteria bacterium]
MYQAHFGLHSDPFAMGPNLRFLFRSHAHAETMAHLGYGLEQGEDFVLIVGAIGMGKTLALNSLQGKVSKLFRQVLVNVTNVSYPEFLKLMLHDLGQTWPAGADAADLVCLLKDQALAVHAEGRKILLIVDEAQNLDAKTLEGVRLLTNLGQPDKQLFQIVLAGQLSLETLINRPELAQLRQRIRIHYHLEPLTEAETSEYIAHRLAVAGRHEPLFTQTAIAKIHGLSSGVPRLVNHLASHALLAAFVEKSRRVDARHVAAEDLPEAPPPVLDAPELATPMAAAMTRPAVPASPETESVLPPNTPLTADLVQPDAGRAADALATSRMTTRRQLTRKPGRRGIGAWIWVWLIVLLLGGWAAWKLILADRSGGSAGLPAAALVPAADLQAADARPGSGDGQPISRDGAAAVDPAAEPAAEPPSGLGALAPPARDTALLGADATARPRLAAGIWIHVASFRDTLRAARYTALLTEVDCPTGYRDTVLPDGQAWRRVVLGPFAGQAAADSTVATLVRRGLVTFHQQLAE